MYPVDNQDTLSCLWLENLSCLVFIYFLSFFDRFFVERLAMLL
jgi:hypothetical protein